MKRLRPALEELENVIQRTAVGPGLVATDGGTAIVTHSGRFHCDEVLACVMLKQLPKFAEAPIVRTRDAAIIDKGTIVVDVGGTYDLARLRFDHHQRGFEETLSSEHKIKLSSAGLVYKHFGREVLTAMHPHLSEKHLDVIYGKVYTGFVEHIDGIDNGIEAFEGGSKNYAISTSLSSRVGSFNPQWNEEDNVQQEMARFKQAMVLVAGEFSSHITELVEGWLPARKLVEEAVDQSPAVHSSGRILRLSKSCPWKGHLADIETEREMGDKFLYVLYDDGSGVWRIQAVEEDGFKSRKALPERLRGLRDAQLEQASGIPGAVFIHASGFIGGVKNYEGALRLAEIALLE